MYEIYKLPQGKIVFSHTAKDLNTGVLCLDPHQELSKHNRPVTEQLLQLSGICVVKLFDDNELSTEVMLNENDALTIPAHQFHIHANPSGHISMTLWKFEGDVTNVMEGIRNNNQKIL